VASGDGGGVGNERGSVHRRGVAVLLAARGLAGEPLTLPSGETFLPVRLDFETDQPVDDVKATADSGARLFLSAKRTCGNDETNLGATVAQWVAQTPLLRPGDVLGLATAHLTGDMEHIRSALKRHHAQPGTAGPADEMKALTALSNKINSKTADPVIQQEVLDAAYVLHTAAVEAGDDGFELAAALLNGTVVAAGDGPAAARALSEAFHTQASRASGSDLADWVHILRDDAQIRVFADGNGPAGAAEHARQLALEDHRTRLGNQDGRIELSLLAENLDPLTVPELAEGLRVVVAAPDDRPEQEPLLVIARRWPRLLLTGLPGMGKSTALRQLAARWALNAAAPLPILVSLPAVTDRCRQATDVTLSVLCEVAATAGPAELRADLAAALEQACRHGHVVLLLDAFDECGDQRPILATGLQAILTALPPEAGVVVATRSSGLSAAQRLGLPAADLAPASNLEDVLDRVLEHAAAARDIDPAQHEAWLAQRRSWLRGARREHHDIGRVPLLATVMALVVANATEAPMALGPARLLRTAVEQSVQNWELRRSGSIGTVSGQLTPAQLLDGFAALGDLLTRSGSASHADAEQAVTAMLGRRWDVRAPGAAGELTVHILRFWDDHVGVFVATDDGRITPRSRVFAEIGAAMAVPWLSDDDLIGWVDSAANDPDRTTVLDLAGEIDPRVLPTLLAGDNRAHGARALAAAALIDRGVPADDAQRAVLLRLLADAAEQSRESPEPTSAWSYMSALASLKLPAGLREQRRQILARSCADEEQQILAAALVALADTAADHQPLNIDQAGAVRAALAFSLPEEPNRHRHGTARRLRAPLTGHLRVAIASIAHLQALGEDMVPHICRLGKTDRLGTYADIEDALQARGYDPEPADRIHLSEQVAQFFEDLGVEHDDHVLPVLQSAAGISSAAYDLSVSERWRLPDLCALFAVIDVRASTPRGYLDARGEPGTLRRWLEAMATAAGLDHPAVAAQAQAAITEHARHEHPTVWAVLSAPAPGPPPAIEATRLTQDGLDALIEAVAAKSEWIAESASEALRQVAKDELEDRLAALLERLPASGRERVAELAHLLGKDPIAVRSPVDHEPAGGMDKEPYVVRQALSFAGEVMPAADLDAKSTRGEDSDR
jgi:hypothetical protein